MRNVSANTRKLTTLAMLAALAIVLVALIHFPLVPAAPFLEYDPADIPIFIGLLIVCVAKEGKQHAVCAERRLYNIGYIFFVCFGVKVIHRLPRMLGVLG